ncbi:MAG: phosphopantothenoylcysteine decarboxylase [Phycisphaerales bacterium]|nr:phosphopantothenoylcysteine decarboxylase [Phycisphaerales bacterium]
MRFLVTAGNTREMIDQVRDWGNIFTGNTGRSIAEALSSRGAVDLLTSNQQHVQEICQNPESPLKATAFRSHAQLRALLEERVATTAYHAIFMTAAVADYAPAGAFSVLERRTIGNGLEQWTVRDVSAGKIRSNYDAIAVLGRRTEKLIDLFRRRWNYRGLLVKFKLEVGLSEPQLVEIAQQSRRASEADYIVANTLEMLSGPAAGAWLLGEHLQERVPRAQLAQRLAELAG